VITASPRDSGDKGDTRPSAEGYWDILLSRGKVIWGVGSDDARREIGPGNPRAFYRYLNCTADHSKLTSAINCRLQAVRQAHCDRRHRRRLYDSRCLANVEADGQIKGCDGNRLLFLRDIESSLGRSQGNFARGEGELSDAASALDWLQSYNPNAAACWIAGFSFGAWIGMQLLMRRPEIDGFIAVAPPANLYDFSFLAPCPSSGLIVQGDKDQIVTLEAQQKLVNKLSHQRDIKIDYRKIPGADHFFIDNAEALAGHVDDYIAAHARIGDRAEAAAPAGRGR